MAMTASDILRNADTFRPSGMSLGEQRARIRAILAGQPVPPQPRVLTAGEPVVLDGAHDPDLDDEYRQERADYA
jgi:hypothetical protein